MTMQKIKGTKIQIPDALTQDLPHSTFGKILAATPVIMTVVATGLAGLSSSEMNRAQYDRSLAAQQQSKAGDQWSFFQAKRLRGAIQRNSFDMLQISGDARPLSFEELRTAAENLEVTKPATGPAGATLKGEDRTAEIETTKAGLLRLVNSPENQQALRFIQVGELPALPPSPPLDAKLKSAIEAVESSSPDAELVPLLAQIADQELDGALKRARDQAQAFDKATAPVNQTIDALEKLISRRTALLQASASPGVHLAGAGAELARNFTAARLRFTAMRYEAEARLNQTIANLYELQVRKSNISADRHHRRSQRFFFGMLGAQAAVIIATFAMAARNRNLLWSLAAGAGLAAVGLAVYVYLYV